MFFAGAEVPSHKKVLTELEAPCVALSYMGLRRRVKFKREWLLKDKFPPAVEILVDSGAYTVNKDVERYTIRELKEIAAAYEEFIVQNIDRMEGFTEFDALPLGGDWIELHRERLRDRLGDEVFKQKCIVIWHPEWGIDVLQRMASEFRRIGIPTTDLSGRNLAPILNKLAGTNLLHGVSMTQVDVMSEISWDSVSSTSWISPQQYGDTIIWTGRELKRYPKKYKDQARKRYRTLFTREGFDAEKIEADDHTELLRLSIWSWLKLVEHIESGGHFATEGVTKLLDVDLSPIAEIATEPVDNPPAEVRNEIATVEREQTPLPVLGTFIHKVTNESGEEEEIKQVAVRSESLLRCDSCFLAAKCPARQPGANCAYNIPIAVKSKQDKIDLQNGLILMQTQRVMFMRFAEQQEGGYADPNLSSEMDRLQKMLKTVNDMEQSGFSLKIEAKGSGGEFGQRGFMTRMFGEKAGQLIHELPPGGVPAEDAAQEILDAEWTDG